MNFEILKIDFMSREKNIFDSNLKLLFLIVKFKGESLSVVFVNKFITLLLRIFFILSSLLENT